MSGVTKAPLRAPSGATPEMRPRLGLGIEELVEGGQGLVGRLPERVPHLADGGVEELAVGRQDDAGHQRELRLGGGPGVVLLPGVRGDVVRLGPPHVAQLGVADQLGDPSEDDRIAVRADDQVRVPPAVLHRRRPFEPVRDGVEQAGAAQALGLHQADVGGVALVAVHDRRLVVPVGPSGQQELSVGEGGDVGAEQVAVVLGRVVGRGRRIAGRQAGGAPGAADEPVTGPSGDTDGGDRVIVGLPVRLDVRVAVNPRRLEGSLEPGRARPQIEQPGLAVPGRRGERRQARTLGVLLALEPVDVEDPPVAEDGCLHGGRLAHHAVALAGRLAARRGSPVLLERLGPRSHGVGRPSGRLGPDAVHHRAGGHGAEDQGRRQPDEAATPGAGEPDHGRRALSPGG